MHARSIFKQSRYFSCRSSVNNIHIRSEICHTWPKVPTLNSGIHNQLCSLKWFSGVTLRWCLTKSRPDDSFLQNITRPPRQHLARVTSPPFQNICTILFMQIDVLIIKCCHPQGFCDNWKTVVRLWKSVDLYVFNLCNHSLLRTITKKKCPITFKY